MSRVDQAVIAQIRYMQPYTRENPKRSILWTLQELDARDKHKLITTVQAVTAMLSVSADGPFPCEIPVEAMRVETIKHGTVLAKVCAAPNQDVQVKCDLTFDIAFQDGVVPAADGRYLLRTVLRAIINEVEGIVGHFEKLVAANPDWIK